MKGACNEGIRVLTSVRVLAANTGTDSEKGVGVVFEGPMGDTVSRMKGSVPPGESSNV